MTDAPQEVYVPSVEQRDEVVVAARLQRLKRTHAQLPRHQRVSFAVYE